MDDHSKAQAQKAVRDFEYYGALRRIGAGTGLASAALASYGAATKSPWIKWPGLLSASASGMLYGKSGLEERRALNKLKRHYDLREKPKLINLSAILPELHEKTAVLGSITDLSIGLAGIGHLPFAMPFAIDMASIPWLAHRGRDLFKRVMRVTAKEVAGKKLSPGDRVFSGIADIASGIEQKALKATGPLSAPVHYAASYLSPLTAGQAAGKIVGKGVKAVEKISPEHADLALDLMEEGSKKLHAQKELLRDKVQYQRAFRELGKIFGPRTREEGEQRTKKLFKEYFSPDRIGHTVKKVKAIQEGIQKGMGAVVASGTGFATSALYAGHESKHPLAKDRLPTELAKMELEKSAFWSGFSKKAQAPGRSPVSPQPPIPPQTSPSDVGVQRSASEVMPQTP